MLMNYENRTWRDDYKKLNNTVQSEGNCLMGLRSQYRSHFLGEFNKISNDYNIILDHVISL